MIDLAVRMDKVCWRYHVGCSTSDVVSKRAVWIGDKTVLAIDFISVLLEGSVDDERVSRFIFMI